MSISTPRYLASAVAIPEGLMTSFEVAVQAHRLLGEFVSEGKLPTCDFLPNVSPDLEGQS